VRNALHIEIRYVQKIVVVCEAHVSLWQGREGGGGSSAQGDMLYASHYLLYTFMITIDKHAMESSKE